MACSGDIDQSSKEEPHTTISSAPEEARRPNKSPSLMPFNSSISDLLAPEIHNGGSPEQTDDIKQFCVIP